MAKETLSIPEERLGLFIDVLRAGLKAKKVSQDMEEGLLQWCKDEEEYLRESFHEEFWPKSSGVK